MVYQRLINLKLFSKPYKFKTEYIKIYEPLDITYDQLLQVQIPTRCLSDLVEILLKPFLIHIKNCIKNNLDVLGKTNGIAF